MDVPLGKSLKMMILYNNLWDFQWALDQPADFFDREHYA